MSSQPLNFDDLTPFEEGFTLLGTKYVVTEASADAATQFRAKALGSMVMTVNDDDKTRRQERMGSIAETEPLLVSLCLFYADENGILRKINDQPDVRYRVTIDKVKSFPARVQKRIFERIKEVSDLSEGDDTPEGVRKEIAKLQDKLARLESKSKNSCSAGEST